MTQNSPIQIPRLVAESINVSFISHIVLYVSRSVHPKKETGMVWRLPHLGQGMGWEYTVAASSMSNALKVWPQSSHLNLVFPRNIGNEDYYGLIDCGQRKGV